MPKRDLTDAFVRAHSPRKREDIVDVRQSGLTLRVTPSGKKTFSVRVRSADGIEQRITLGSYPELSLRDARIAAADKRAEVRSSIGNLNLVRKVEAEMRSAAPTLRELLAEYKSIKSRTLAIWKPSSVSGRAEAELRIEAVFGDLLDVRVTEITADDLADTMLSYVPRCGQTRANGQTQKARLYLMPLLDWAAGRERFRAAGRKRRPTLDVADLRDTADPASDDPEITGARDRVLTRDEMVRVLPLLVYPAPPQLRMQMHATIDVRPLAPRYILLTAARLDEVVTMMWRDVDIARKEWLKPIVKTTRGRPRSQLLPLPDAAIDLLASLPGYARREPDTIVFQSSVGGLLSNWTRITTAIQRETGTAGWRRHDLRRTSSTLMRLIGVDLGTIDRILGHRVDHGREGTSRALDNYLGDMQIDEIEDPQRVALNRLADVYSQLGRS